MILRFYEFLILRLSLLSNFNPYEKYKSARRPFGPIALCLFLHRVGARIDTSHRDYDACRMPTSRRKTPRVIRVCGKRFPIMRIYEFMNFAVGWGFYCFEKGNPNDDQLGALGCMFSRNVRAYVWILSDSIMMRREWPSFKKGGGS